MLLILIVPFGDDFIHSRTHTNKKNGSKRRANCPCSWCQLRHRGNSTGGQLIVLAPVTWDTLMLQLSLSEIWSCGAIKMMLQRSPSSCSCCNSARAGVGLRPWWSAVYGRVAHPKGLNLFHPLSQCRISSLMSINTRHSIFCVSISCSNSAWFL